MKIGICGGTFDPFHRGHLEPILAVRDAMQWDRVLYIPAFLQPFKVGREHASGYHRFSMAVLATESYDDMWVLPLELERGEVSYSVDTLRQLRRQYRDATFDWVIGDDNLEKLHEWKSIDAIFEMTNFVVLTRDAEAAPASEDGVPNCVADPSQRPAHGAIVYAENPTVPISSTEIRRRVLEGESIDDLVDARVSRYIHHHGLYGKGQS